MRVLGFDPYAQDLPAYVQSVSLDAIWRESDAISLHCPLTAENRAMVDARVLQACKRGVIVAKAVVTKRIKALTIEGKTTHTVGIPLHFGFKGLTKPGYLTNTLTPVVGDGNSQTPEFKSFLVKVEKA